MDSLKESKDHKPEIRRDDERASLIDEMLTLSSEMVEILREHRGMWAAEQICDMLLPYSSADAVSITDTENVLCYRGYLEQNYPRNCRIRTKSTKEVLREGWPRVLLTKEDIGFPESHGQIEAAIVEPIMVSREPVGVLKFYFRDPSHVTESQISTVHGFAKLIGTQLTASEVDKQRELSALMELKMLQSQINPHFLFNTISTISSFTRTNPEKAREMLRQFAAFYRGTLEQDSEVVRIEQEIENVERYVSLQQARFGEDRLSFNVVADPEVTFIYHIPPFTLQPIVENSILHGMRVDKPLHVEIEVYTTSRYVTVEVRDNGKGMTQEEVDSLFEKSENKKTAKFLNIAGQMGVTDNVSTGLGLAMNNVYERFRLAFGPYAGVYAYSKPGEGTIVRFKVPVEKSSKGH